MFKKWKKSLLTVITFSSLSLSVVTLSTSCSSENYPVVKTQYGKVRGVKQEGISSFKGIPYGANTKYHRFQAPVAPTTWTKTKDCKNYGPACPQDDEGAGWEIKPQSEDCLNLNVWTPSNFNSSSKIPVLVYIHGGVFEIGGTGQSGNHKIFDGTQLAKHGIVVVTINYRLNALGFLTLTHLQQTLDNQNHTTNGNWGILDQIFALQWVQNNINNFGGDKNNVTIMGESAGAFSVSSLILSPMVNHIDETEGPLFEHAIMESGNLMGYDAISPYTKGDPIKSITLGTNFVKDAYHDPRLGDNQDTVNFLRSPNTSIDEMIEASKINWDFAEDVNPSEVYNFIPDYDGWVLPFDPIQTLQDGNYKKVDILWGYNTAEGLGFIPTSIWSEGIPKNLFQPLVRDKFAQTLMKPDFDEFIDDYFDTICGDKEKYTGDDLSELLALASFSGPMTTFADLMANNDDKNIYFYNFDCWNGYPNYKNRPVPGSLHTSELSYVFGNLLDDDSLSYNDYVQAKNMSNIMMTYWTNFVKTGNPNSSELITWPKYQHDLDFDQKSLWFVNQTDDYGIIYQDMFDKDNVLFVKSNYFEQLFN